VVLLKDDCKILVLFKQIQNFKVSNLAMAKAQKVTIAVTYFLVLDYLVLDFLVLDFLVLDFLEVDHFSFF
jgi:hypothetical protein